MDRLSPVPLGRDVTPGFGDVIPFYLRRSPPSGLTRGVCVGSRWDFDRPPADADRVDPNWISFFLSQSKATTIKCGTSEGSAWLDCVYLSTSQSLKDCDYSSLVLQPW